MNSHLVFVSADKKFEYYTHPNVIGFDAEKLMALKWHDAKREVLKSEYDVEAGFARFMKVVEKAIADGLEVKNREKFEALKKFNASYESAIIDETLGLKRAA